MWAYLVRANRALFSSGSDDHVAQLLFGNDERSNHLEVLKTYGEYLNELKVAENLPARLRNFTLAIKSEAPIFNKTIPNIVASKFNVCFTKTVIHRKFLPARKLDAVWFPLLIDPMQTDASIVLPSRYWLPELVDLWHAHSEWTEELSDQLEALRYE